jgi:hypothetical protein
MLPHFFGKQVLFGIPRIAAAKSAAKPVNSMPIGALLSR